MEGEQRAKNRDLGKTAGNQQGQYYVEKWKKT